MAARATWKGFLKISLVNIPIKVFPATESSGDDLVQPAARRVPDAHPAEALVPALQPRGAELGDRQGLRVREGALRRPDRGGLRQGPPRVDARHRSRAVRRRVGDRSDVRRSHLLPRAGRRRGGRRVRRDARRHEGQGRHRQARAVRPRVPGRRAPARARHRHVHAAPRRRDPQHRLGRGAELGAVEGEARGDEAGAGRSSRPSRRRSICRPTRTSTAKGCSRSSTRRSPARRSSRRRSRRRRRSST